VTASSAILNLAARRLSAVELVDAVLTAIAARGAELGCFAALDPDAARAAAIAADAARAAGDDRPLLGVPIVVKDIIDAAGFPTRFGARESHAHRAFGDLNVTTAFKSPHVPGGGVDPPHAPFGSAVARGDAACVAALRAAGCVVLGKAATNEWAFGIDGRNPWRPPCRNPHDLDRLAGGSSSGPAVAVAAGLALGAVGSDTSGSLRTPGALCGVVALRPTPGRIPLTGIAPLAPSYDVAGPLGATVAAVALLFAAMAGPPPALARDGAGGATPAGAASRSRPRIAVLTDLVDAAHPDVARPLRALASQLDAEPIAIPELADALAVHATNQLYEANRVHVARGGDLTLLAPDVQARIAAGAEIDDAAYTAGRAARARISAAILAALDGRDALLAPSAPITAPRRDADTVEIAGGRRVPLREALLATAVPFAQAPVPALTLPLPPATPGGLPVGAQLIGHPGGDEALLAIASAIEARLQDS
jgi:Asp-tRNA(Asn)/Glu-tRNA(Gln) amidotransferase A subunit family amidase